MELVKREDHWALYNEDGHKIAATLPGCNSKLSIKNCESIANGYDLDELAKKEVSYLPNSVKLEAELECIEIYKEGFQKAMEILGDKKFSEEDVISMIEKSRETGLTAEYLILTKQQTEFDVEILMGTNYRDIDCVNEGNLVASKIVKDNEAPMLDKDGCLILRRL